MIAASDLTIDALYRDGLVDFDADYTLGVSVDEMLAADDDFATVCDERSDAARDDHAADVDLIDWPWMERAHNGRAAIGHIVDGALVWLPVIGGA